MRRLLLAPLLLLALLLAGTGSVRADDEEPGAALLASGAVFVEGALGPAEGAVAGPPVSLLLTLGTTHWFSGAPTLPDPEVEGAIVRRFGNQAVNASDMRNGERYATQTWTWWIYPRRAGTCQVPALDVVIRTVDDDRGKVEVRARTKPLSFEVGMPPDAAGRDALATSGCTLKQTLDPEAEGLKVGDALRRTLTMRADDVPGMLIPPVPMEAPGGLRAYPDAPRVEDEYDRGTLVGVRIQSTSYVLEREGAYVLPEVPLRWWNLEAKAWEEAVAEAVAFTVAPNPDAVSGAASSEGGADDEVGESGSPPALLPWLLGALLLLGVGAWVLHQKLPAWKRALAARRERRRESEAAAFRRFEDACRTNDPARARRALRAWLDRAAGPAITLEAFVANADDEALAREVQALENRLYGSGTPGAWEGDALATAVARARRRTQAGDRPPPTARRPLNPRGSSARP